MQNRCMKTSTATESNRRRSPATISIYVLTTPNADFFGVSLQITDGLLINQIKSNQTNLLVVYDPTRNRRTTSVAEILHTADITQHTAHSTQHTEHTQLVAKGRTTGGETYVTLHIRATVCTTMYVSCSTSNIATCCI